MVFVPHDDGNVIDVGFFSDGTDDYCTGTVTFDDACQAIVMEEFECSPLE